MKRGEMGGEQGERDGGREKSRERRCKDEGSGKGKAPYPGAKSFHMGSAGALNPPNGPAGKGLLSQFYKGGNGGSEAPSGAEPRKALKSAVRLPGDWLWTLGKRLALLETSVSPSAKWEQE